MWEKRYATFDWFTSFANENLLCGFSVCKSQYVYNNYLFVYLFICTTLLFKYKQQQQQQQFKADLPVGVTFVLISLKLPHEFPQDANNTARD